MNRYLALLTIVVATVLGLGQPASAQQEKSPFEGVWSLETPQGPRPLEATFRVNGAELTGTMQLGDGKVVPLSSGTVQDKVVSFSFVGAKGRVLYFTGTLKDDVIDMVLSLEPNDYGSPYTAKRK